MKLPGPDSNIEFDEARIEKQTMATGNQSS